VNPRLSPSELASIEASVQRALQTGDESALQVLGYGEISTVLRVEGAAGVIAAKRLPRFSTQESWDRYQEVFARYVTTLKEKGVKALTSILCMTPLPGGLAAYCLQPILPPESLAPKIIGAASEADGRALLEQIIRLTAATISPSLGLDAQLSNWAVVEGELRYLDLTTPMLRGAQGEELLDTEVFLASLPWALRWIVRRWMLGEILSHYYASRAALVDLVANLYKERLERWVPIALELSNRYTHPPLTEEEARRYYTNDASTWALLQRLRRLDRAWQRYLRRRPYPFLLPGKIER
jgi:hypothetical protein